MAGLPRSTLEAHLRAMTERLAKLGPVGVHTVWEQVGRDGKVGGFLVYRAKPGDNTPVVLWLDGDENNPSVTFTYINKMGRAVQAGMSVHSAAALAQTEEL